MMSYLHKLVRICLAVVSLIAFSHRIFKQNNCDVKYFTWKYQTILHFLCSWSYLFTFLLSSQFYWQSTAYFFDPPVYCFLVYTVRFPIYLFFLHCFLTYFLPYLSFPLRVDPLRFQARYRKRRLNLGFSFSVFILCCSTFLLIGECVLLLCWV